MAQKYTVDNIKALEPYVSVKDGHFKFDVKQAKADNIDSQLIEGQLKYFDVLNDRADAGDIEIEKDLTIINNEGPSSVRASHWPSCGGGLNTDVTEYWWGYSRYACDCETQRMSADFNSCAYWWLLASRLDANNHGYGVYIEMTWALVFDITPQ